MVGEVDLTLIAFVRVALRFALIARVLTSEDFEPEIAKLKGHGVSVPFTFKLLEMKSLTDGCTKAATGRRTPKWFNEDS